MIPLNLLRAARRSLLPLTPGRSFSSGPSVWRSEKGPPCRKVSCEEAKREVTRAKPPGCTGRPIPPEPPKPCEEINPCLPPPPKKPHAWQYLRGVNIALGFLLGMAFLSYMFQRRALDGFIHDLEAKMQLEKEKREETKKVIDEMEDDENKTTPKKPGEDGKKKPDDKDKTTPDKPGKDGVKKDDKKKPDEKDKATDKSGKDGVKKDDKKPDEKDKTTPDKPGKDSVKKDDKKQPDEKDKATDKSGKDGVKKDDKKQPDEKDKTTPEKPKKDDVKNENDKKDSK